MKFRLGLGVGFLLLTGCLTTMSEMRERDKKNQVDPVQERQAQQQARVDDFEDQMRRLNGRIDVLENHLNQVNAGHTDQKNQELRRREDEDKRLKAYEEALAKIEAQLAATNEELRQLKTRKETPEAKPNKDSYKMAEEAFTKRDFKQAIVDYEAYRKQNPKGKNYPAATFKIGMAFHELNMKDEAKAFYEEVVAKFPSSKEAKKASQKLKAMK